MYKFNNKTPRTKCEICSEFTIKTPERRQWCRSGVFIVNFEHVSQPCISFVDFRQENARCVRAIHTLSSATPREKDLIL